jgi:hypothetical protein
MATPVHLRKWRVSADYLTDMDKRDEPMAPTQIADLEILLKDIPAGAWVAISSNRDHVVSFGADMREVLREAQEKGETDPLIFKVPEQQEALLL